MKLEPTSEQTLLRVNREKANRLRIVTAVPTKGDGLDGDVYTDKTYLYVKADGDWYRTALTKIP